VVQWVASVSRDESLDRAAAAVARLEGEFAAELRTRGAIRLPDPASLEPVRGRIDQARAAAAAASTTSSGQ
jgi:hypothetical protein